MSSVVRDPSFDLLRFPLAIIILVVHVFSVTGVQTMFGLTTVPQFPVVQGFINAFVRGHSVPIFFFISGYVFFLGKSLTYSTYVQKIKKRLISLLLPYLAWNIIALIAVVLVEYFITNGTFKIHLDICDLLSCFWNYDGRVVGQINDLHLPVNGPSWYVRDLMIVILFSPILNIFLKGRRSMITLIVLFVLYLCSNCGYNVYLPITAILFFATGAYFSLNNNLFRIRSVGIVSLIAYFMLSITCYMYSNVLSDVCYGVIVSFKMLIGVATAYNIASYLTKSGYKVNDFLSSSSFFIYMGQSIIYGRILKVLCIILAPDTMLGLFAVYLVSCALIIVILVGLYYLIKRYSSVLSILLLGGR